MKIEDRIQNLENQIQDRLKNREILWKSFEDAPGKMESWSDHFREDLATEIAALDQSIEDLQNVVQQLRTLPPNSSEVIQVGNIVRLKIGYDAPEMFLMLMGLGGITAGDITTLSVDTVIGKAIIGKKVGDSTSVQTPSGQLIIQIISCE